MQKKITPMTKIKDNLKLFENIIYFGFDKSDIKVYELNKTRSKYNYGLDIDTKGVNSDFIRIFHFNKTGLSFAFSFFYKTIDNENNFYNIISIKPDNDNKNIISIRVPFNEFRDKLKELINVISVVQDSFKFSGLNYKTLSFGEKQNIIINSIKKVFKFENSQNIEDKIFNDTVNLIDEKYNILTKELKVLEKKLIKLKKEEKTYLDKIKSVEENKKVLLNSLEYSFKELEDIILKTKNEIRNEKLKIKNDKKYKELYSNIKKMEYSIIRQKSIINTFVLDIIKNKGLKGQPIGNKILKHYSLI